jgi:hypothetical protein
VRWKLARESTVRHVGGDGEPEVEMSDSRITRTSLSSIRLHLPSEPGEYRLFVTARDDQGRAATSNLPIRVLTNP